MSTIETKEIGIPIGIGVGRYHRTEYVDGNIQIRELGRNDLDEPIYDLEGYWESDVIDLVGKFKEYDRIVLNKTQVWADTYAILTRVSDDGINFDEYIATTPEGKIQSEMKRYIQVKISLFAGLVNEDILITDFNSPSDIEEWTNNEFITADGVLRLKRDYEFNMLNDETWSDDGSLHRKLVVRDQWKKIDNIDVI